MNLNEISGLVPNPDPLFVPFGVFDDCEEIIKTRNFFPTLLTGLSGLGKTKFIKELCAKYRREYYRVNITFQTDEDDLIGGLRLKDGNTVFEKGPVIQAMESGGILLLDECDLASPMLIMCLQSILEGEGYLIKKTGEFVVPKEGFQIFATANTKGLGDTTGSFVGTQVLNEAFLERFPITFECFYPPREIEKKILEKVMKANKLPTNEPFIETLLDFATDVRTSYDSNSFEHTISTRRLVHMINAFKVWGNEKKAVQLCLNRFNEHTRNAFFDIFTIKFDDRSFQTSSDDDNIRVEPWQPW